MRFLLRGATTFTEVPDNPATTTVARGDADTHATSDQSVSSIISADPLIPAVTLPASAAALFAAFAHVDAPIQWFAQADAGHWFADAFPSFVPVAGVVTDLQGMSVVGRGEAGSGGIGGSGSGEIASGSDGLVAMSSLSDYSDHGWFIVPSASNEYGGAYAAADSFAWDSVTGTFASDFFIV